jgi:hypothetical protein
MSVVMDVNTKQHVSHVVVKSLLSLVEHFVPIKDWLLPSRVAMLIVVANVHVVLANHTSLVNIRWEFVLPSPE